MFVAFETIFGFKINCKTVCQLCYISVLDQAVSMKQLGKILEWNSECHMLGRLLFQLAIVLIKISSMVTAILITM